MKRAFHERRFADVDTKSVAAVRQEVSDLFWSLFPGESRECIHAGFGWVEAAFLGAYDDYQPLDAKYHDFEHTLQVTLCYARLLEGYQLAGTQPALDPRMFELGIFAILLHDTGYLKREGDEQGTGAKYTLTHVNRSAEFSAVLLTQQGFSPTEIRTVQNMIRCTGVNADLKSIPFQSELERTMGFALGTADLLGQMAADDYIDKLGILFQEFEEANRFSGRTSGPGVFKTALELRQNTPGFWHNYVLPKINVDFNGLHRFLETAPGESPYLRKIEANIHRLRGELEKLAA